MPHRNRVTPEGEIIADPGRGLFMGNRGILHDDTGQIMRPFRLRAWITCVLAFKGRLPPDPLVSPGRYTRLFFLDEAVAMAAGHRPCAECRRADYNRFRAAWEAAGLGRDPRARDMDDCLHRARITPRLREKVVHIAAIDGLPDGAFIATDDGPCLLHAGRMFAYSPAGYGPARARPASGEVHVLTPAPTVRVLRAGYAPGLHATAAAPRGPCKRHA